MMTPWGEVATYEPWTPQEMFLRHQGAMEAQRYAGLGAMPLNYPWTPGLRSRAGLGAIDLSSITSDIASGLAADALVDVSSQFSPDYTYDPSAPAAAQPSGFGPWFVNNVVKPKVVIRSRSTGAILAQYAPGGDPSPLVRGVFALAAGTALVGTGYLIFRGLRPGTAENPKRGWRYQPVDRRRRRKNPRRRRR